MFIGIAIVFFLRPDGGKRSRDQRERPPCPQIRQIVVPTVANGKVYIRTRGNDTTTGSGTVFGEIDVCGLLPN